MHCHLLCVVFVCSFRLQLEYSHALCDCGLFILIYLTISFFVCFVICAQVTERALRSEQRFRMEAEAMATSTAEQLQVRVAFVVLSPPM